MLTYFKACEIPPQAEMGDSKLKGKSTDGAWLHRLLGEESRRRMLVVGWPTSPLQKPMFTADLFLRTSLKTSHWVTCHREDSEREHAARTLENRSLYSSNGFTDAKAAGNENCIALRSLQHSDSIPVGWWCLERCTDFILERLREKALRGKTFATSSVFPPCFTLVFGVMSAQFPAPAISTACCPASQTWWILSPLDLLAQMCSLFDELPCSEYFYHRNRKLANAKAKNKQTIPLDLIWFLTLWIHFSF